MSLPCNVISFQDIFITTTKNFLSKKKKKTEHDFYLQLTIDKILNSKNFHHTHHSSPNPSSFEVQESFRPTQDPWLVLPLTTVRALPSHSVDRTSPLRLCWASSTCLRSPVRHKHLRLKRDPWGPATLCSFGVWVLIVGPLPTRHIFGVGFYDWVLNRRSGGSHLNGRRTCTIKTFIQHTTSSFIGYKVIITLPF